MNFLSKTGVFIEDFLGIPGFDIYWYGVCIAVGFLLAFLLASYSCRRRGYRSDLAIDMLIVILIGAMIGARGYYVVFEWNRYYVPGDFLATLKNIVDIRSGGLAIYGGIIGGVAAARGGLKKWIWPMTFSMLLTCVTFVYLSFSQTSNLLAINACVFIEQFGYGFGFTAYMLYLMYYADGPQKTAHYAICTGFMALGMMIPGMFAGWLQEQLGYNHFFVWVMLCSVVPVVAVSLLKIDPDYGRRKENDNG